jgi:hypothetical protein
VWRIRVGFRHCRGCRGDVAREGLESLRRSLAMLPPQTAGRSREQAMRLLAQLQEMDQRLRDLREGLTALLERASPDAEG